MEPAKISTSKLFTLTVIDYKDKFEEVSVQFRDINSPLPFLVFQISMFIFLSLRSAKLAKASDTKLTHDFNETFHTIAEV